MPDVLVLTTSYPSPRSAVAGAFVREHAAALPAEWRPLVLHLERSPDLHRLVVEEDMDDVARIVRVRFPERPTTLSYAGLVAATFAGHRRVRRLGFRADIVHAHFLTAAVPAAALAALVRRPFVVSEHWSVFLPDDPASLSPALVRAARVAFARAAAVLPVSEALARGIEAHGVTARIHVVPNAVDVDVFRPAPEREPSPPLRLLTVALFYEAKGIDVLLEALALLRREREDVRLDVVGDGELRQDYEAIVRRHGLDDVVSFRGVLPKAEVAELMRAADLYVLPSRFDNNPVALLEALATGLPCVATAVGGVPEAVGEDGILTEPEPEALAGALQTALDRLPTYDRTAIARRAVERFGAPAVGRALAEVYAAALKRSNARRSQRHAAGDHGRRRSA